VQGIGEQLKNYKQIMDYKDRMTNVVDNETCRLAALNRESGSKGGVISAPNSTTDSKIETGTTADAVAATTKATTKATSTTATTTATATATATAMATAAATATVTRSVVERGTSQQDEIEFSFMVKLNEPTSKTNSYSEDNPKVILGIMLIRTDNFFPITTPPAVWYQKGTITIKTTSPNFTAETRKVNKIIASLRPVEAGMSNSQPRNPNFSVR